MANEFDVVYDQPDADEIVVIRMTRRQWHHLNDWRADHPAFYPNRAKVKGEALDALYSPEPEAPLSAKGKDA